MNGIPLSRPSWAKDLDLSRIASRSRVTECGDIRAADFRGRRGVVAAMALDILGDKRVISIP